MKRIGLLCAALWGTTAVSAELTRVASSFEEKDPFGLFFDFSFNRVADRALLSREWYVNGVAQDVPELRYQKYETSLGIDLNLGLYKDFEFHFGVPIAFQQDREWSFAASTDQNNSTIFQNCGSPAGAPCATPGSGNGALFAVPNASFRGGLGDLSFGLAWNAFVQKKDASKPNWTIRFTYTAPTASLLNPSVPTSSGKRGAIGEKIHRYAFSTALSRRINAVLEPYFELHYVLPWQAPGFYSNCDDGSADRLSFPENCGRRGWSRSVTGIQPAHTGGIIFGTELNVLERMDRHQRFAVDVRLWLNYISEGRMYNEASDLLGKLLYTSDNAQLGGQLGFVGLAAEFIKLKASASIAYHTEHWLTNEAIGKDLNGDDAIEVSANTDELNPNYDFRVDRTGRRFRISEQFVFRIQVTASFIF
jgi:hypothetical protein